MIYECIRKYFCPRIFFLLRTSHLKSTYIVWVHWLGVEISCAIFADTLWLGSISLSSRKVWRCVFSLCWSIQTDVRIRTTTRVLSSKYWQAKRILQQLCFTLWAIDPTRKTITVWQVSLLCGQWIPGKHFYVYSHYFIEFLHN